MKITGIGSALVFYLVAVAVATLLGSIVQTQFNLAAIASLGPDISPAVRLHTTLADILGFAPLLAVVVGVGFILALPAAALLGQLLPRWRPALYSLAGGLALWVAVRAADSLAPMPTLIAATRTLFGTLAMVACAALGAYVFYRLNRRLAQGAAQ